MVPGLLGFQSQALPYLIPGVVVNGDTLPDHSVVTLFELFSPTTVVHSGARASALNDMHAGLAAAMVAVLFSPTSCYGLLSATSTLTCNSIAYGG
jgi:hypothetical protein